MWHRGNYNNVNAAFVCMFVSVCLSITLLAVFTDIFTSCRMVIYELVLHGEKMVHPPNSRPENSFGLNLCTNTGARVHTHTHRCYNTDLAQTDNIFEICL